jgi:hypothetical protein
MEVSTYRIKGWSEFQHYSKRRPPWIKLYTNCIEEFTDKGEKSAFFRLTSDEKLSLMLSWLLASHFGGKLPDKPESWYCMRLGIDRFPLQRLVESGFIECESDAITDAIMVASTTAAHMLSPEREREREQRQSERESETPPPVGVEGTQDPKPKTEPPPSKPVEPEDNPLVIMAQKVRGCRPEYSAMTVAGILHHLRYFAGHPHLERTVNEWCASHANAVEGYQMPLKSLAKALSTMAAAPTRARAFGE